MRSTSFAAALFGAAAVAGCGSSDSPSRADIGFAPARIVSHETENGATPMYLVAPNGDRVVSWVSAPGGGSDGALHLSVTRAGTTAAAAIATLRDSLGPIEAHGEAPPQLAADSSGHLYVLYAVGKEIPGERFPISALRFSRSDDGGRTWSAPVTINDTGPRGEFGAHNFHALTVGPDGLLLATWLDARTGKSGVWMARSTDGGKTWEPNRPVYSDPTCPCCRTSVAVGPDRTIYVAWRAVLAGDVRDIVVIRSTDAGATWSAPVRPRDDAWVFPGCPHAGPSLKVGASGAVHIAWWTGREGQAGVYYGRSTDGGQTFVPRPLATGERSTPAHVQLALRGSDVVVVWDDGLSTLPRVLLRRSQDGGATFAASQVVSEDDVAASFPVVAAQGDSLMVAWSQTTAAAHRERLESQAAMKDPKAPMRLPRVGQSEIFLRAARL